jgi:hypothetical protein
MGVLLCEFAQSISLNQIFKHPRFRLGLPQALNSGCVSLDKPGEELLPNQPHVCIIVGCRQIPSFT